MTVVPVLSERTTAFGISRGPAEWPLLGRTSDLLWAGGVETEHGLRHGSHFREFDAAWRVLAPQGRNFHRNL